MNLSIFVFYFALILQTNPFFQKEKKKEEYYNKIYTDEDLIKSSNIFIHRFGNKLIGKNETIIETEKVLAGKYVGVYFS